MNNMSDYEFKKRDFDNPSFLFKLEDKIKAAIGGRFMYYPYYRQFNLKGSEIVLDFGCGGGVGSKCLAKLLNKDGRITCVDTSKYWIEIAKKRRRPRFYSASFNALRSPISLLSFSVLSLAFLV